MIHLVKSAVQQEADGTSAREKVETAGGSKAISNKAIITQLLLVRVNNIKCQENNPEYVESRENVSSF